MFREITHCRVCGNSRLLPIVHLGDQFLTGTFPKDLNQTLTCGPLELVRCDDQNTDSCCGLVQLRHSYAPDELYGDGYGYRSALNCSMVKHLGAKAQALQQIVPWQDGDLVLDIGSNDGTSLGFYDGEKLQLVGIDPSAEKFRHFYPTRTALLVDFFSAQVVSQHFEQKARLVTSIAMFYDLEDPLSFMREVHQVLHEDGIWHLEQSYLPAMLSTCSYDTICHEHLEYYALKQIKWMADRAGFKIIGVETNGVNGGSFAVTMAKIGSAHLEATEEIEALLDEERAIGLSTPAPYERFKAQIHCHRDKLKTLLSDIAARGETVFGLGASTKGNVLLQFCELSRADLPCIAEVNEDKFGAFTPGTGIPIVSEAQARALKPDYFLVLPWHFRDHIIVRESAYLEEGGKLILPLPCLKIVDADSRFAFVKPVI